MTVLCAPSTAAVIVVLAMALGIETEAAEITVASFNLWGAGGNEGKSTQATVAALKALDADILALQEVRSEGDVCDAEQCDPADASVAAELGEALGYYVYEQTGQSEVLWANAILSRYPIEGALPNDLGAVINVNGDAVAVFNVHLTDYPYQPYQLTGIEYGDAPFLDSEEAAIAAAESARGAAVDFVLATVGDVAADLTIICGDFNEPSYLDWTERAVQAGRVPVAVAFPASRKIAAAGFADAYRSYRPDEIADPGYTWTPMASPDDEQEHHDRIDFIYVKGHDEILSAEVGGESAEAADIVVESWPSDHRALRVRVGY